MSANPTNNDDDFSSMGALSLVGADASIRSQHPYELVGHATARRILEPGDRADVAFELGRAVALEAGMRFAMREGGRTVGAGIVSRVE